MLILLRCQNGQDIGHFYHVQRGTTFCLHVTGERVLKLKIQKKETVYLDTLEKAYEFVI